MYEKLFIALFSFILGVLLFKYREWYSEGSKRKKVLKKLKAKILFWIIEDWNGKFEKVFIVGHALSLKYNPIENINELESQKKLVDDEIESRISEVKNQFSNSSVSKDFIDSIPKLHEKQFDAIIEHFDNYLKKIDESRFLISLTEIDHLDSNIQVQYYDFESKLSSLLSNGKGFFYALRYDDNITPEEIDNRLVDLCRSSIQTTFSMYLLLRLL